MPIPFLVAAGAMALGAAKIGAVLAVGAVGLGIAVDQLKSSMDQFTYLENESDDELMDIFFRSGRTNTSKGIAAGGYLSKRGYKYDQSSDSFRRG